MFRSKLTLSVALCALIMLTVSATGTVAAAPESPGGGIDSPLTGVESEHDTENSSNASIQTASSVGTTAQSVGDVPAKVINRTTEGEGRTSFNDIIQTDDGNYLVIATDFDNGNLDGAVSKHAPDGSVIWLNRYGDDSNQRFFSGIQTQSGGYVLSGSTETTDPSTAWAVKIDQDGDKMWEFTGGGSEEVWLDVEETANGEYLFAGTYNSSEGDNDAVVVKTTSSGDLKWVKNYSHSDQQNSQEFRGIEKIENNRFAAVGGTNQNDNLDGLVFIIDSDGNTVRSATAGHSDLDDVFNDVAVVNKGALIYAGVRNGSYDSDNNELTSTEGWLLYDTADDQNEWSQTVSINTFNVFNRVDATDNRIVAAGSVASTDPGKRSQMTAEFDLDGSQNWISVSDEGSDQLLKGVVAEDHETYVVGDIQQNSGGDYNGQFTKFDPNKVVLSNVSIDQTTVTRGSTSTHTLSFDALQVSADDDPDEFTITIPDSVTLEAVNDVSVESTKYDANETVDGNAITFQVNPNETAENIDLSITAEIELSAQEG